MRCARDAPSRRAPAARSYPAGRGSARPLPSRPGVVHHGRIRHVPPDDARRSCRRASTGVGRHTLPALPHTDWDRHTLTELPHPARAAAHQAGPSHTDRAAAHQAEPPHLLCGVRQSEPRCDGQAGVRHRAGGDGRSIADAPDLAIIGVGSTRDPRPRASAADDPVPSAPIAGGSTADTRTSRSSDRRGAPATRSGGALGLSTYGPRSSGDRAPPSGGGSAGSNPAGGTTLDLHVSLSVTAMNKV